MEFIQLGFKRQEMCIYVPKGACSSMPFTVKLLVLKSDDTKQLGAKMQEPAGFNKQWWHLDKIREEGEELQQRQGRFTHARELAASGLQTG